MTAQNAESSEGLARAERRAENLASVLRIATTLSAHLDLEVILAQACRAAVDLLGVSHSGLVLFADDLKLGTVRAEYPNIGACKLIIPLDGILAEERLIATRQPLFVRDVANEPGLGAVQAILGQFGICSTLFVPVIGQNRLLGSFSLDSIGTDRVFTADEVAVCQYLAAYLAVAIDNAQLYAEKARLAAQLESLRRVTLPITASLDRSELLRLIPRGAAELINTQTAGLYEYHPAQHELVVVADFNRPDHIGATVHEGEGVAGRLVASGAPYMIVEDYDHWPERAPIYAGDHHFGAVLEVPLQWKDQRLGVLYVADPVGRRFTQSDAHWLAQFADQAATALVNTRLLRQEAAKLKRLESLAQATQVIMGNLATTTLDTRLELIAHYAADILAAEACGVFLVKQNGYLSLEASYGSAPGSLKKGKQLAIRSGPRSGLTGHIAYTRRLFNTYGADLTQHFAVAGSRPSHLKSGRCSSLLAIPLIQPGGAGEELIGLLRVDNKLDDNGQVRPDLRFNEEDEWLLSILAKIVVVAIEGAAVVDQLNAERDYLQRLISASPSGIVATDGLGHIQTFNEQAQTILGYDLAEVLGRPVDPLFVDPRHADQLREQLSGSPAGHVARSETVALAKSGSHIPIRVSFTRLNPPESQKGGTVSFFEDLRDQKEIEQRVEMLLQASTLLSQARDLKTGLQRLAEMMTTSLQHTFCRVLIIDEVEDALVVQAAYPMARGGQTLTWVPGLERRLTVEAWPGLRATLSLSQPVVRQRETAQDLPELDWITQDLGLEDPLQSVLLVPLYADGHAVGLLMLGELRSRQRQPITPATIALIQAVAVQTAVLIDKLRLTAATLRRERLLDTLEAASRHIRAYRERPKLLHEIVRLAAELVECTVGLLLIHRAQLRELEVAMDYGLATDKVGLVLRQGEGLTGLVARTGEGRFRNDYAHWPEREPSLADCGLQAVLAVPLKNGAEVEAVLLVGDTTGGRAFGAVDQDIMQRFAINAAIALQTSQLVGTEQRTYERLAILHQISTYAQTAHDLDKILHVLLTGITAGYGLGFNRAGLLLLDEAGTTLVGRTGIGGFEETAIREDWRRQSRDGLDDFRRYLELLDRQGPPPTPVGDRIQHLRLAVGAEAKDAFTSIVRKQTWRLFEAPSDLDQLPEAFRQAFLPALPFIAVPLVARQRTLGLLVADNKVTRSPITSELIDTLLTFVNTAGLAIDNLTLYEDTRQSAARLRELYQASSGWNASRDPEQLLQDCVTQVRLAAGASHARMILIDQVAAEIRQVIVDEPSSADRPNPLRPDEQSLEVMRTCQMQRRPVAGPASELVLPLVAAGSAIGVLRLSYDRARHVAPDDAASLQLYANQAAMAYDGARRIKELRYVRQAFEDLAQAGSAANVLQRTVAGACQVLGAISSAIWSYDEARQQFVLEQSVAFGIDAKNWEEFSKVGPRPGGTVDTVMQRGLVAVTDIEQREHYPFLGESLRLLRRIGAQSFLALALKVEGERLGVLFVNYPRPRGFSDDDRQTAQTLANHAALALRQARQMEHLRRTTRAAEVVARVLALGNRSDTLQSIATETKSLMECDAVVLFGYEQSTGKLVHPPIMDGVNYPDRAQRTGEVNPNSIVYAMVARDALYQAEEAGNDPFFANRRFRQEEHVESVIAVPLVTANEKVGVMFINYRTRRRFLPRELENVSLLADQAATAIANARVYEAAQRRERNLRAVLDVTTTFTSSLELDDILTQACRAAFDLLNVSHIGLVLFAPDQATGAVRAEYPDWGVQGTMIQLRGVPAEEELIRTMKPMLFPEVQNESRLDPVREILVRLGTTSLALVPVVVKERLIGSFGLDVMGATRDFTPEEIGLAQVFAAHMGVAIENARLFQEAHERLEELERAKSQLAARTALAFMGMANNLWRHTIEGDAVNIRSAAKLLGDELTDLVLPASVKDSLAGLVRTIDSEAVKILTKEITPPLASEESIEIIRLNDLIRERVSQLSQNLADPGLDLLTDLDASDLRVRVSPFWLRSALDILVNNAVEAVAQQRVRQIKLTTRRSGRSAVIRVEDSGAGIAPDIAAQLFNTRIVKPGGGRGLGMGLLMAQLILQACQGTIAIERNTPAGTTFQLTLPLA